jgi:mono/diheme cytochrome c family protein
MLRTLIFTATFAVVAAFVATTASGAGDAAAGKTLYDTNCMSCHGMTGKGDGPVGAVLTPSPRDFSTAEFKFDTDEDGTPGSDADLTAVIQKGAGAFGGSPLMAPWPSLSDDEIGNLIAFIRSLKK